jgi:tetratricopeptide (TPR) repeat protein
MRYLVEHSGRPVYFTVKEALQSPRFELVTAGLIFEARPRGEAPDAAVLDELWSSYEWHAGTFEERCRDYTADMILADYHYARGRHEILFQRKAEALESFRRAAAHAWGVKEVLNNLGGHLAENGLADEAIPYLLAAWEVEPGYAVAGRNLAIAYRGADRYAEGLPWFLHAIENHPKDGVMLLAAARGARARGQIADAIAYYLRLERLGPKDPALYEEIKGFLQSAGWRPELLEAYDERAKTIAEERKKVEQETLEALEKEEPAISGAPRPAMPRIPDIDGEADTLVDEFLGTSE